MKINRLLGLLLATLMIGCADVQTPAGTSLSVAGVNCVIDLSSATEDVSFGINANSEAIGGWTLGQGFSLTENKEITSANILVKRKGLPKGTLTLEIQGSSGSSTPLPDGTALGTATFGVTVDSSGNSNLGTISEYIEFTFASKVSLTKETLYWMVLSGSYAINDNDLIYWIGSGSNPYASGRARYTHKVVNDWTSAMFPESYDFLFKLGCQKP